MYLLLYITGSGTTLLYFGNLFTDFELIILKKIIYLLYKNL